MGIAIFGTLINWFLTYTRFMNNEIDTFFKQLTLIFILINTIGLLLAIINKKLSGILIITTSLFFIPLGLIAAFGGKIILDQANKKALEKRRSQ